MTGLNPFTEYSYALMLDGKKITDPSFRFKTYPAAGAKEKYAIAFGSGARYMLVNEGA